MSNAITMQKLHTRIESQEDQDLSRSQRELEHMQDRQHQTELSEVGLSPVMNLPVDILRHIFTLCCNTSVHIPLFRGRLKPPQLTLCQVSSIWRHIVLATPVLWSKVIVNYVSLPNREDVPESWLARAGSYPVSLEIWESAQSPKQKERVIKLVEKISILPHSYRRLYLMWYPDQIPRLLSSFSAVQLWSLEVLEIHVQSLGGRHLGQCLSSDITLPNVKILAVSGNWDVQSLLSAIQPNKLQRLVLHCQMSMSLCLAFLQRCTSLEKCTVDIDACNESDTRHTVRVNPTPTMLPKLRWLSLLFENVEDCCMFIDQLVLVELEYLKCRMRSEENLSHKVIKRIALLSQRSKIPSTRQSFIHTSFHHDNLGILFRSLPYREWVALGCPRKLVIDKRPADKHFPSPPFGPCMRVLETGERNSDIISGMTDMIVQ